MGFDPVRQAVDVVIDSLWIVIMMAAPVLIIGLAVGLIFAIFQTATSIQEQTLAFIPKMLAVALLLILLFPWMARLMMDYTIDLWGTKMPVFLTQGFGDVMPPQPMPGAPDSPPGS